MDDQPTCGKGLAAYSPLPAAIGDLTDAMALVMELHMEALEIADPITRPERDAYEELASAYRRLATELHGTARRMAGYRDLPMGRHDMQKIAAPANADAYRRFVSTEEALLTLLQSRLGADHEMLESMGADRGAG